MRLIDYLSVPYILQAETVERADGTLIRRLEYPELPDCSVECESVLDGLVTLERKRVRLLIDLLKRAERVPVPRPPLESNKESVLVLEEIGLRYRLEDWLGADEGTLVGSQLEL